MIVRDNSRGLDHSRWSSETSHWLRRYSELAMDSSGWRGPLAEEHCPGSVYRCSGESTWDGCWLAVDELPRDGTHGCF